MKFLVPLYFAAGFTFAGEAILDQVVSGQVVISQQANGILIEQASQQAWLDWQQFSIADQQVVQFLLAEENGLTVNRVTGGDASSIFGQLISNGTVYLINPNGILFAESSRIDVGGLFATDHWLSDANVLTPSANSQGIQVHGNIRSREELTILASELTLSGQLQANNIQLLGNSSALLSLDNRGSISVLVPADAGATWIENSGVLVANDRIYIGSADTNAWLNNLAEENNVSVAGELSASRIDVYGTSIDVVDATFAAQLINIESQQKTLIANTQMHADNGEVRIRGEEIQLYNNSAINVGTGKLTIGGQFQGQSNDNNADFVYVSNSVNLTANAGSSGDGGEIIVWSDGHTEFHGRIEAKGGELSGDGGFAEVSGKQTLTFRGDADLTAAYGRMGTLLLDPTIITIADGAGTSDDTDGVVLISDYAGTAITIYQGTLEGLAAGTDIILQASESIIITDLTNNALTLNQTGQVTFQVFNTAGQGSFIMQGADDSIVMTGGGSLTIEVEGTVQLNTDEQNTALIDLSNIEFKNGGNLTVTAKPHSDSITSDEIIITIGGIEMNGTGNLTVHANNSFNNDVGNSQVTIGSIVANTVGGPNKFSIEAVTKNTNVASNAGDANVTVNGVVNITGLGLNNLEVKAETSSASSQPTINMNGNSLVETNSNAQGSIFLQSVKDSASTGVLNTKDLISPGGNIILGGELVLANDTLISVKKNNDDYFGVLNLGGLQSIDGSSNSLTLEYGSYSGKDLSKFTNLSELNLSTSSSYGLGVSNTALDFSQASLNSVPVSVSAVNFSSANNLTVSNVTGLGFSLGLTANSNKDGVGDITIEGLGFSGSQTFTTNGNLIITESLSLMNNDFVIESGAVTIANGATDLIIDADLNFTNASSIGLTGNAGTTVTLINRGDTGGNLALQNLSSTNAVNLVVDNRFNLTNVNTVDLNGGDLTLWAFGGVVLSDATLNNLIIDIDRDNNGSSLIDLGGTNSVNNVSLSGSASNDSVLWDGAWTISGNLATTTLQNFQLKNAGITAQSLDFSGTETVTVARVNSALTAQAGVITINALASTNFDLNVSGQGNVTVASAAFSDANLTLQSGAAIGASNIIITNGNLTLSGVGATTLTNGTGGLLTLNNATTLAGNINYSNIAGNVGLTLNAATLSIDAFDSANYSGVTLNGANNSIATTVGDLVLTSPTVNNNSNVELSSAGALTATSVNAGTGNLTLTGAGATTLNNGAGNVLTLNNAATLAGNINYDTIVGNVGLTLNTATLSIDAFDSANYSGVTLNGASNSIATTVGDLVLTSPAINNNGNLALTSAGDFSATNINVGSGSITLSGATTTNVNVAGSWVYDRLVVGEVNSFTSEASLVGGSLTSIAVGSDITLADGSTLSSDRVVLNAGGNISLTGVSSTSPMIPSISVSAGGNILDGGNTNSDIDVYWIYGLVLAAGGSIADSLDINYKVDARVEDQFPVNGEVSIVINDASESKNPVQSSQASVGNLPRSSVDLYLEECNSTSRDCRKNNAIRKFLGSLLIGGALPQ